MADTVMKELFNEKFRPKTLGSLIAPKRIKAELNKGLVQNLLLHGSAGTGKTSTLFILAEGHSMKFINASSERGIDTIREEITKFCSGISLLDGKDRLKCIILDEIDGATNDFFMALRSVMEKYSGQARFIASCNNIHKIPDAIKSRFHLISYDPVSKAEEDYVFGEYVSRVGMIMDKIGIAHTDETMRSFVRGVFPDMRSVMNRLQSMYLSGTKELTAESMAASYDFKELFDLCLQPPKEVPFEIYKTVMAEYSNKITDALRELGENFPKYIRENAPNKIDRLPLVIIALADYQFQSVTTVDPAITLMAAVYKIQDIMK